MAVPDAVVVGRQRWSRLAAEEDATIVFSDECGVEADHCPRRGYSRKGERATMDVPDRHIRRNVISAVGNKGTAIS